jgi:hypothetical protein
MGRRKLRFLIRGNNTTHYAWLWVYGSDGTALFLYVPGNDMEEGVQQRYGGVYIFNRKTIT